MNNTRSVVPTSSRAVIVPSTSSRPPLHQKPTSQVLPRKQSIIVEQDIPASSSPRVVESRKRTYDNFRIIFFEQFKKLIPVELQSSTIKIIKSNSVSNQAYERIISEYKTY